jgi:plasmid segregation protein ParM
MKQQKRPRCAHSIDVGLGYVKHTTREDNGTIGYRSFPAVAIPSDPSALRQIASRGRNTIDVPVVAMDGVTSSYEVGPDIVQAQTATEFGRILTGGYYASPIYDALMLGALRFIGATEIDVLVVGLPVGQYLIEERRNSLVDRWKTGPEGIDTGDGHRVVIRDVIVRPQPLGGYVEALNHLDLINAAIKASPSGAMMDEITESEAVVGMNVLVVDPGEHTLDWLVVSKGNIVDRASGAAEDAGRHRIVRAVTEALQADIGRPLAAFVHPMINAALSSDKQIVKLMGEFHDLTKYRGVINASVEDPVNKMVEGLRGMLEIIDLVIIVGGHPQLYRDQVAARFKSLPIVVLPNPVMANVSGYQAMGEMALEHGDGKQAA